MERRTYYFSTISLRSPHITRRDVRRLPYHEDKDNKIILPGFGHPTTTYAEPIVFKPTTITQPAATISFPGTTFSLHGTTFIEPGATLTESGRTSTAPNLTIAVPGTTFARSGITSTQPPTTYTEDVIAALTSSNFSSNFSRPSTTESAAQTTALVWNGSGFAPGPSMSNSTLPSHTTPRTSSNAATTPTKKSGASYTNPRSIRDTLLWTVGLLAAHGVLV